MKKNLLATAGVLTAGLVIGSAFAISGANAADTPATTPTSTNASTSATTTNTSTTDLDDTNRPDAFSTTSIKPGESLVTGDALTKLTDAALAKYPGATVIRVENDSDGAEYEVHLKLADGSVATVEFDSSFNITGDHEGFADASKGGPKGPHHDDADGHDGDHEGDNDGDGPAAGGFTAPTVGTTAN